MGTEDAIDRRDYGRLEAQVEQLKNDVHALKETVESMRDMMQQAQGGWRTLMMVGGASAALASGFSWVITHVGFK
jgi:GTP1/Obg family GTP-binding protein